MTPSCTQRLRTIIAAGETVIAPGAYDALSARIVERVGFSAVYLGGNAMALQLAKGQPFLTLSETIDCAAKVTRVVATPVIIDAGAGFGPPAHATIAVRQIESTGVAALHVDDQPYPKAVGYHHGQGELLPIEAACARYRAVVAARRDPDLMIIARTDALRVNGTIEAAIERCRIYLDTGVDALMVLDLSPAQTPALRRALGNVPLVWIGGVSAPIPTLEELLAAGFALALFPFNAIAAATDALANLWSRFRATGQIDQDGELLARMRAETLDIAGMQDLWHIERGAAARRPS